MAVSNIYDVSPATSRISCDPKSGIAYDVNSAVDSNASPYAGRIHHTRRKLDTSVSQPVGASMAMARRA